MNNLLPGSGGGVGVVRILWIESDGDDRMSSSVRNSRFYGGGGGARFNYKLEFFGVVKSGWQVSR